MCILRVDNKSANIAEIEMQSGRTSRTDYLPADDQISLNLWQMFKLRTAEEGNLGLRLKLLETGFRLELYRMSATATKRLRSLAGTRPRNIRLRNGESLLLVPVGTFTHQEEEAI